jgi:hypothetical protein
MAWGILLIAAGECAWRTFSPNGQRLMDFELLRAASLLWLHGADPFAAPPSLLFSQAIDVLRTPVTIYPTTLLLLSPFAMVSAGLAKIVWEIATVLMIAGMIAALVNLAGWRWKSRRTLFLAALVLGFGPIQSGALVGQPLMPAATFVLLALWAFKSRRDFLGGMLLGLAVAWKPQIAIPFVLFALFKKQWIAGVGAVILVGILSIVAIAPMQLHHPDWPDSLRKNVNIVFAPGEMNDFQTSNPSRDHMLNLQMPAYAIYPNREIANIAAFATFGLLAAIFLTAVARWHDAKSELLDWSIAAAIGLLPVYHRYYDGALLLLAACWAIDAAATRSSRIAWIVLALLLTFLAPVGLALTLARDGRIPSAVLASWWWKIIIVPGHAWALLGICVLLMGERILCAQRDRRSCAAMAVP